MAPSPLSTPPVASAPRWRHFTLREVREALAWAAAGNIAVHDTGLPLGRYAHTCHLFAKDEAALRAAAAAVGCQPRWIQRRTDPTAGALAGHYTTHFDLFGARLTRALARCTADAAALAVTEPAQFSLL